ncbi:MAG: DUF2779 domain-containing protein [Chloroflexi bacterium]|nr:DUF2779 domain-containing protein [Chloroflexota bacterium]
MPPSVLSKTNFLYGLQCHKYLWTLMHEPHSVPPPDAAMQFVFDQGHEVGDFAKKLFPGGIDIPTGDFSANTRITRENLNGTRPIFEAGILADNIFCRVDVLNPVGDGSWDIIEVKSATSVKDVNILDVAFQRFCCESAGLKIRNCKLAYINTRYIRHGEIDPQQLFTIEDITERVSEVSGSLAEQVEEILAVMYQQQCPEEGIGPHCTDPYECPLQQACWSFLPENNIFDLYWAGKKRFELYKNGIVHMKDLPAGFELNGKQQIQVNCVASGEPYVNKEGIKSFLDSLQYPVYYLDFETFGTAIPLFEGIRPYQQIPFQFSLHVALNNSEGAVHFSFLAEGPEDPRPKLAAELKQLLGDSGSIVAYYAPFEKQVLNELAVTFPEYREWVDGLQGRIIDLLKPFSNFHYYHPKQKGSASLKKVLPALTGISYEGLSINDGKLAGVAFMAATFGNASEEDRRKIRRDLQEYCGQDTGGMVEIINKLCEMAG